MIARTFDLSGAFIISDFVPYLAFLTKWQGWQKKMEDLRDCTYDIADRMLEIKKHRERAKEQTTSGEHNDHVPNFLDVLLQTPLEDGQVLPDKNLTMVLMVRTLISSQTFRSSLSE